MEKKLKQNTEQKSLITPEKLVEEIKARASQIFMERGDAPGDELSDWLQAEKEIKKKYNLN